ncbi:3-deoxy-manno-octulosonate cytidylyltransferase [bacterium HR21]|jgi:3-deoxy-manno-octulosonate cytidylyltransferase (CMP-KDO synthetase)|nr:3-deoxy-manno-octulosonate cytidylyltransferase [bacterium HR21]
MTAVGIIPARYASQRLPGKPLRKLCGKPLVQWVWEAACTAPSLQRVVIATDHERIAATCRRFGAEVLLTPTELPSGTDRVAVAYQQLQLTADIVVNLQADEPLLQAAHIEALLAALSAQPSWDAATLIEPLEKPHELSSPMVVKVVLRSDGSALYFSRSPIPFVRDVPLGKWLTQTRFWKHIGIYAYRAPVLQLFRHLSPTPLERAEGLEQLRLLEAGLRIGCVPVEGPLKGVDTPAQLAALRKWLRRQGHRR